MKLIGIPRDCHGRSRCLEQHDSQGCDLEGGIGGEISMYLPRQDPYPRRITNNILSRDNARVMKKKWNLS